MTNAQPRTLLLLTALLLLLGVAVPACACGIPSGATEDAIARDPAASGNARDMLRRFGRAGFDALVAAHADLLDAGRDADPARYDRLAAALETLGHARDNDLARLYWHTDLADAQREAARTGRPILALHLLGGLDEEMSCANSRFFRTALYPDPRVASLLRERFVLHWTSVRPTVPRITIDFGDGRTLERTITGNSAHVVLDADGRPLDVLPGLYGPAAFRAGLERALALHDAIAALPDAAPEARIAALRGHHAARLGALRREWRNAMRAAARADVVAPPRADAPGARIVPAARAGVLAESKAMVENPLVRAWSPDAVFDGDADRAAWDAIADQLQDACRLGAASRTLIARTTRAADPAALERIVLGFERSLARDTARNEYDLHRIVHGWFASGALDDTTVAALADRVYADLFLTPADDPWLGLNPADVYTAIAARR